MRIAKGCKGLPLAIVVIDGLLAKSNMTREYWEFVAGKVNLLVSSKNDEDCSKILLLSYNHLPIHLKSYFLYMDFFIEDYEIKVSDLTESWVVEGFLKPIRGKSLEEVANEYLTDLIERNLILIHNCRSTFAFPYSLKKLELWECRIPWENMTVIGSLPSLEILLLYDVEAMEHSSLTHEWINPVEGGFRQLKFLLIYGINLKRWRAESIHFPKLEILQLFGMDKLEEIPSGIGEIETLRKIELDRCSSSVVESAKEIYEEQQSFGNEDFQLFINSKKYQN
ncbi:hypothetical protein BUALT_Bualt07G0031800 [Buddleja alternifolia]|uniref:Disease resistance protein winged helix domain-containing protein n=1 Tax=Buddleja alternifolia TaxID=168488 RepID=A0AAV6XEI3_9LAMI|nr:hypothetical protein BUALT_Bualt07G0031800 [Buddleja alternifolia]